MGERVAEDPPLPGQQRVHEEEMGHRRGRRRHQAEPTPERDDPELERQQQLQHQPEPERRDRDAGDRDDSRELVHPRITVDGREDAQRHAEPDREEHRARHQLEGVREIPREVGRDRLACPQRASEVTAENTPKILAELDGQRPVEPVLYPDRLDHGRRRVRARGQACRVAGSHVGDRERDAQETEQHEAQQDEPPGEVAEQPTWRRSPAGRGRPHR